MNIWENFNFKDRKGKSAYDYLKSQQTSFISKSGGVLSIEIESKDSTDYQSLTYDLYVISESLGGYRKKILSVIEGNKTDYFPVTIISDLNDKVSSFVDENDFLYKIEEMLTTPSIKRTIENLYQQSRENK